MRHDRPDLFGRACGLEDVLNVRRAALGKDPVWLTRFNRPLSHAVRAAQDPTVVDASGRPMRFRIKREAEQAANDAEAQVRAGATVDPAAGRVTFGEYAPVRGRGALGKADACWLPMAQGLTPHGLRHTYKTLMIELGTPATLMDAQMGHEDGSVQARYSHITSGMTQRLLDGLTELWAAALDARREFDPRSPVAVLDRLLGEGAE
jgi:hypothetical protein